MEKEGQVSRSPPAGHPEMTTRSMRSSGGGDAPSVGHNLPRIPSISQHSRVAISKSSQKESKGTDGQFANIVPVEEVEMVTPPRKKTPSPEDKSGSPTTASMLTPPSEGSPSESSSNPPDEGKDKRGDKEKSAVTPIKLRIRKPAQDDDSQPGSTLGAASPAATGSPTSVTTGSPGPAGTAGSRARIGRAKTKGDIKKQLMEKREKKLQHQTQSPTPSPSPAEETQTSVEASAAPQQPTSVADTAGTGKPASVEVPVSKGSSDTSGTSKSKATKQKQHSEEQGKDPSFMVGDMVWSKVPGHPWWPSMVSYDPFISVYTKLRVRSWQFHVQFFGDEAERGWIPECRMLPYKGREQFESFSNEMMKKEKSTD